MRDVLPELMAIWRSGGTAGVGTVVRTFDSAPRPRGASMVVAGDGTVAGSVSGGCVEGAVYEQALLFGAPTMHRYGVGDDEAMAVGLTCGGTLDIFVETISSETFPDLDAVAADVEHHRPVAVATVVEHPDQAWVGRRIVVRPTASTGTVGSSRADDAIIDDARGMLAAGRTDVLHYGPDGERLGLGMTVFVSSYAPRAQMVIFGAIDFAAALARQGSMLGYRVTVCDARATFATPARFPAADDVVVDWPHRHLQTLSDADLIDERTVLCVLTHDPKFDIPLLDLALRLPTFGYLGAMGSRRTHDQRIAALTDLGITDLQFQRLSSPIGLDLGARTPEETAVSIAAEIIARRWGGKGEPLRDLDGRIHHS